MIGCGGDVLGHLRRVHVDVDDLRPVRNSTACVVVEACTATMQVGLVIEELAERVPASRACRATAVWGRGNAPGPMSVQVIGAALADVARELARGVRATTAAVDHGPATWPRGPSRPGGTALVAHHRGQHEADPAGREGARGRAPPGALRRRRRRQRGRLGASCASSSATGGFPVTCTLMGLGAFPRAAPAVAGHARDARHARGQLRDGRGRPHRRRRRPLRRPHHRQAVGVRAAGEVHPHRRRPGGDLQEHPRAHPDRRRRASTSSRSSSSSTARSEADRGAPGGVVGAHRGLARASTRSRYDGLRRHRDQARSTRSRRCTRRPAATRSSPPTSASTRCGRRSTSTSPSRAAGSTPAGSGRWASACPPRWAPRSACPTSTVVCITGDGSIQMNAPGARDLRAERHPVKVFIINNGYLGMVRQWQELFWDGRYSQVDMGSSPTSSSSPRPTGATGMRLTDKTTLVEDMRDAIETPGPVRRRRARHPRGEHVPDDPAPAPPRATWWAEARMGEPGTKEVLLASRSSRPPAACARAASTSCRSSSRTSRAC